MPDQTPDKPMTSLEAAALYLSNGETNDPAKAAHYTDGTILDMDELQRAHLRRMMGVDFGVSIKDRKMTVFTKEYPYVSKSIRIGKTITEKTIDKLVDLCLSVKLQYEEDKAKEESSENTN